MNQDLYIPHTTTVEIYYELKKNKKKKNKSYKMKNKFSNYKTQLNCMVKNKFIRTMYHYFHLTASGALHKLLCYSMISGKLH